MSAKKKAKRAMRPSRTFTDDLRGAVADAIEAQCLARKAIKDGYDFEASSQFLYANGELKRAINILEIVRQHCAKLGGLKL